MANVSLDVGDKRCDLEESLSERIVPFERKIEHARNGHVQKFFPRLGAAILNLLEKTIQKQHRILHVLDRDQHERIHGLFDRFGLMRLRENVPHARTQHLEAVVNIGVELFREQIEYFQRAEANLIVGVVDEIVHVGDKVRVVGMHRSHVGHFHDYVLELFDRLETLRFVLARQFKHHQIGYNVKFETIRTRGTPAAVYIHRVFAGLFGLISLIQVRLAQIGGQFRQIGAGKTVPIR